MTVFWGKYFLFRKKQALCANYAKKKKKLQLLLGFCLVCMYAMMNLESYIFDLYVTISFCVILFLIVDI